MFFILWRKIGALNVFPPVYVIIAIAPIGDSIAARDEETGTPGG